MSEEELELERRRLVREAMAAMERRGEELTRSKLVAELGIARTRLDALFPDDNALFDAMVEEWFAPKLAVMDEVMASELPIRRKLYEFFARRFILLRDNLRSDPVAFRLYIEMGEQHFERARSFIDLADHYLCELIAEAQAEGYFPELAINDALSVINQMVNCYIQPYHIAMLEDRLSEEKLARIIDTLFAGLSGADRGARGVSGLRAAK